MPRARAPNGNKAVGETLNKSEVGIDLLDRVEQVTRGEARVLCDRRQETRIALEIHPVRRHAEHDLARRRWCFAERARVAGRAVQTRELDAEAAAGARRTNRPAIGSLLDEPELLPAGAGTIGQFVSKDDRQDAENPIGHADCFLGAKDPVLEVFDDVLLARRRRRAAPGRESEGANENRGRNKHLPSRHARNSVFHHSRLLHRSGRLLPGMERVRHS